MTYVLFCDECRAVVSDDDADVTGGSHQDPDVPPEYQYWCPCCGQELESMSKHDVPDDDD